MWICDCEKTVEEIFYCSSLLIDMIKNMCTALIEFTKQIIILPVFIVNNLL